MMKLSKKEEGFTLIEVLAALALTSIVMGGLMSVFWFGFNGFKNETTRADLQYSARQARGRIIDDFRQCSAFAVRDNANLDLGLGETGPRLYLVKPTERLTYYVYNDQLYRQVEGQTPQPAASYITEAAFCNPTVGLLKFSIKTAYANYELSSQMSCKIRID